MLETMFVVRNIVNIENIIKWRKRATKWYWVWYVYSRYDNCLFWECNFFLWRRIHRASIIYIYITIVIFRLHLLMNLIMIQNSKNSNMYFKIIFFNPYLFIYGSINQMFFFQQGLAASHQSASFSSQNQKVS